MVQLRRGDGCDDDDDDDEEEEGGGIVESGRVKNRPTYIPGCMRRNTSTQKKYSTTKNFIRNMKFIKTPPLPPSLPPTALHKSRHASQQL